MIGYGENGGDSLLAESFALSICKLLSVRDKVGQASPLLEVAVSQYIVQRLTRPKHAEILTERH